MLYILVYDLLCRCLCFFNDTATTEIYTILFVGSVNVYKRQLQRLKENFAAGTYTKDPDMTEDLQYLKTLRSARYTMAENPKIDEYVFNGTEAALKRLVDYNEGSGEIPKFYYDIAQGQKHLNAWDIASAQYL